jgi:thiamine pyrophosphokinase
MTHAIILIGGTPPSTPPTWPGSPADRIVIAADTGLHHAAALGLEVDLIVGDLDSVDPGALAAARARGIPVESHPRDKDATDFELALVAARARGARHVTVVGGTDGRFDHALANVHILASPEHADLEIRAHLGSATITVVRTHAEITAVPGEVVSLLPVGGPALGVTTTGLRWALTDATLLPGSGRTVSNECTGPLASVRVTEGTVVVVQPGAAD